MAKQPRKHVFLIALVLSVFFLWDNSVRAQIKLDTELTRGRFLQFEPVRLRVFVENNSGNNLTFDYEANKRAHLTVAVKHKDEAVYETRVINKGLAVFRLAAGQRREFDVVLNAPGMFNLNKADDYIYYVQIGNPRLTNDFRTKPKKFEVREGQVLWKERVGNPGTKTGDKITSRVMSVLWFRGKVRDRYVLVIRDDKNIYAVKQVGDRASDELPICRVDARSNVHILQRLSARVYGYKIFDYYGRLLQMKIIAMDDNEGPPGLVRDKELGVVRQVGGREAVRGEDYEVYNGEIGDVR